VSVSIRPAAAGDVDFLVELYSDDDVRPFLAAGRTYDREWVVANLGQLVVAELDGAPAGAMAWEVANERSGIVHVSGLAVHPDFRGRRLADEAARLFQRHLLLERGFHRIELEVYGFNERAQRHAERSGFVREGVKRQAYRRGDGWVDGVLYGLVAEDLDPPR
jgi:ribosomal protein S18 acetylase RimI-like enzyme